LSGNNNDGELIGDVLAVTDQNGRPDGAYYFAGSQDWINLPDVMPGDDFSVIIKFRPLSFLCCYNGQVGMTLFSNFTNAVSSFNDANGLEVGFDTQNNLYLYNGLSGASVNYNFGSNQWYNMIITHENETLQIFVNDSLILQQAGFLNSNWSSSFIRLGARANVDPLFLEYNGLIDDVAIYDRGLSIQEINDYYNQTPINSTNCTPLPSNLQQGLVGYWPFCGSANDESGNGNDGTVNGATLTEDRFGNAEAAYGFDGMDDKIEGSIINGINTNEISGLTMSGWMLLDSASLNGIRTLMYLRDQNTGAGYSIVYDQILGKIKGISGPEGVAPTNEVVSSSSAQANVWTYVTMSCDFLSNLASFYINADLQDVSNEPLITANLNEFGFGKLTLSWDHFGSLDDIGIWNRALTPEEVQELYTLEACTFTVYDTLYTYETLYDTLYTYETVVDTLYEYETITTYDTVTTYLTVTDTLIIDVALGIAPNGSMNTLLIYPNPASDLLTIHYGNFAAMEGYTLTIFNNSGSVVHTTPINQQQETLNLALWSTGSYQVAIYNSQGVPIDTRTIVIQ
jgi:hypothetical protein